MKSTEMNANDAVIKIEEMETPAEITAFTDGDERKTVLNAANARLKVLNEASDEATSKEKPSPQVFPSDRWIYSETEEPKILRKGTPLPDGFTTDRKAIKTVWENTATGGWKKKEEKKA